MRPPHQQAGPAAARLGTGRQATAVNCFRAYRGPRHRSRPACLLWVSFAPVSDPHFSPPCFVGFIGLRSNALDESRLRDA